ncbi:NagB/RpiA/CoA transferase-like superfamily protein [Striga hermonthica]|uniref:Translation initiation factor eIF2B subunit delta n=1 Tax=Striga hermonthica TaxID=68872 RepID=A0A9N7MLF1_STRHE|nr:NagB/RpiA/CoA transferase-like superfamily protein [Striga hermonthica]
MDPRRVVPRAVIDPIVRQVGFFAPTGRTDPAPSSPPVPDFSPSGNTLPLVMIPPPRHLPTDLSRNFHRAPGESSIPVGSYNPSEFLSPSYTTDFSEDLRGSSGEFAPPVTAVVVDPVMGVDGAEADKNVVNLASDVRDGGPNVEIGQEKRANGEKPLKNKTTKAERRAIQEAQRAAKAAAKGEGSKKSKAAGGAANSTNMGKPAKSIPPRKESSPVAAFEKRTGEHQPDKDRKKDVPHARMQFDDENKVEKAKKRSVVKQIEARNRVELFRHLPQYEYGTRLSDLGSKFFELDSVHSAVYKVGMWYLAGDITGGNARCIAMLQAFQESIKDYTTPPEKILVRDLTAKINTYISFLIECRPLSISMGNAIRFLKSRVINLSPNLSEAESKACLISDIDRFIDEKIILADKVIVKHAVTKIRDGDVLLTYGSSSAVEMIFLHAHEQLNRKFRVVIVDSRPKLEGRKLLRRLVGKGINCTYTHINAVSYVMHEVTRVFLGASSVLSNGTVYSRVGTACVAMVANQFHVPVLVCCEAYKFHERVQLDSICSNELGDPDVVSKVSGREEINYLDGWANSKNLLPLNLIYDATPSDYISMIITDYGMIPPTSVPVIVREYRREQLWM